jgi:predicted NUDIX family NTP pyrophosphohydrolase
MKQSAGILLYTRAADGSVSMLLVHPSGPYNRNAPFGIPKGEPNEGEALETTARREVLEETGVDVTGDMKSLGYIDYTKSRKRIHAWAAPMPEGANPQCASWEIDKAQMFGPETGRKVIHRDQAVFIDRLLAMLAS